MNEIHPSESAVGTHMDEMTEIAALAQRYYDEAGRPEGQALDHWLKAERELHPQVKAAPQAAMKPTEADLRTEEAMHLDM